MSEIEKQSDITIDFNDPKIKEILKEYKPPKAGFDKVGFARPLGGFFMEFSYAIIGAIFLALTFSQFLRILYPYPDSKAYASVGNILFSFLFFIMNIPTGFSLERFVAEYRIKNPAKMIQFIRFYVWYQMLTGIGLVTITSVYTLFILETGNLVYAKWLLLVYISREYPAMSEVFLSTLKGLQRFDYQNKVNYIASSVIQPFFELVCVLIGRHVLGSDPRIGELLGIAIGYAVGTYIDDFFTMMLSIHYLRKVIKPLGFSIHDVLIPHVEKDVWKESLLFGLKLSPPGILSSMLGFFTFFWWYDLVPAYATLMVLNSTADSIANIIRRGGGIYLKATMSEALNNKKLELGHYYIAMALKFSFMTMMAIGVILITFLPIITEVMFITGGLEEWLLAIAFIVPNMISSTTEQVKSISGDVILGGNHPGFYSFSSILNTLLQLFWEYLILFVFKWPTYVSIGVLVWILALRDFPVKVFDLIINYVYIHFRIVKLRIKSFAWQTWIAPIPAALCVWGISELWFKAIYSPFVEWAGVYVTAAITILVGFLSLLWVFFPIYTAFGGWDEYNIKIFHEAIEISGPSRFLFRPIYFANRLLVKSPLHNKHPIPWKSADEEAEELMKIRFIKDHLKQKKMP